MTSLGIFSSFPLEFGAGGEATAVYLANWLGSKGFDVSFVFDSTRHVERRLDSQTVQSQVHYFSAKGEAFQPYAPVPPNMPFRRLPRMESLAQFDVNMILLDRIPPPAFLSAVNDAESRVLFLFHGLALERPLPPHPAAAAYQLLLRFALRSFRILARSEGVHFQAFTEPIASELSRSGISSDRIHLIPSGIPFDDIPEPKSHDSFGVLFMGRMVTTVKGTDFLSRILSCLEARLPEDVSVRILGSGPDEKRFRRYRQGRRIHYLGYVSNPQKVKVLSGSDLLLVTSYIEPFSLVTVEGLAAGLRVVTTPASGPRSIVESGVGFGETQPYRPRVFVDSILKEYHRWRAAPDRLLGERRARRTQAMGLFSAETMARRYEDLLRRMA